ncbi:MAG: hypothetical protein KDK78_02375 [Chlamydiia bacterium]|nr:hypothetical protein [Chlamydiia bacterium]
MRVSATSSTDTPAAPLPEKKVPKAWLPFAALIYGCVETTKKAFRGVKHGSGAGLNEIVASWESGVLQLGKAGNRFGYTVGSVIGLTGDRLSGLGREVASTCSSGFHETELGIRSAGTSTGSCLSTSMHSASKPLKELSKLCPAGAHESTKAFHTASHTASGIASCALNDRVLAAEAVKCLTPTGLQALHSTQTVLVCFGISSQVATHAIAAHGQELFASAGSCARQIGTIFSVMTPTSEVLSNSLSALSGKITRELDGLLDPAVVNPVQCILCIGDIFVYMGLPLALDALRPAEEIGIEMASGFDEFLKLKQPMAKCVRIAAALGAFAMKTFFTEIWEILPRGVHQLAVATQIGAHRFVAVIKTADPRTLGKELGTCLSHGSRPVASGARKLATELSIGTDLVLLYSSAMCELLALQVLAGGKQCVGGLRPMIKVLPLLPHIGGPIAGQFAKECTQEGVAGASELGKGAGQLIAVTKWSGIPALAGMQKTVAECISSLASGTQQAIDGAAYSANVALAGLKIPPVLMHALIVEVLMEARAFPAELQEAFEETRGGLQRLSQTSSGIAKLAAAIVQSCKAGGSQGSLAIRQGVPSLVQMLQLPESAVAAILQESIGQLSTGTRQMGRSYRKSREEWNRFYESLVALPIEIWYYRRKYFILGALRKMKTGLNTRRQEVSAWWDANRQEMAEWWAAVKNWRPSQQ